MKTRCLITACAVAAMLMVAASPSNAAEKTVKIKDWKMVIAPRETTKPASKKKSDKPDVSRYQQIYNSIPFNRAEYRVNPSYRHDATMEILFGKQRETTIQRVLPQAAPRQQQVRIPYRYNNNVSPYGLNYSFYFPYWNARGAY